MELDAIVKFQRNPDYIFRRVVDEMILVPIHQDVADMDSIYTLNEVGAFIWERLVQPASVAEISASIIEEFAVDPDALSTDLEDFLDQLGEFGAISRS